MDEIPILNFFTVYRKVEDSDEMRKIWLDTFWISYLNLIDHSGAGYIFFMKTVHGTVQ